MLPVHLDQTVGLHLKAEAEVWIQQQRAECAHTAVSVTPGRVYTLSVFHAAHGQTVCSPRRCSWVAETVTG